jgi:hypothetical protein
MVLRSFEDRLERMVEGVFTRAFKSGLQPIEIARRIVREIDASRTVDVAGRSLAPNRFVVRVSSDDAQRLAEHHDSLVAELATTVRQYAAQEGLGFLGRVSIEFETDSSLRVGGLRLYPSYDERITAGDPDGYLETVEGKKHTLINRVMTIGRLATCDIVLDDQNVSRQHAEIHPVGDAFQLVDLGSTNGCKVNGVRVQRHVLADGDRLTFGPVELWFRRG